IYMSSLRGLRPRDDHPLYTISKAAIVMLARTAARWLGPRGIRSHVLCPGGVDTAFPRDWMGLNEFQHHALLEKAAKEIPLRRVARPDDIASLVTFLGSDQSMYLTGLVIPVDGGLSA